MIHAEAGGDADQQAVAESRAAPSLATSRPTRPGLSSPSVMPRSVTASAWQPVLPVCPAMTGRKTARMTSWLQRVLEDADHGRGDEGGEQVDLQPGMAQPQAARRAASRAAPPCRRRPSCPTWALISIACSANSSSPRTSPFSTPRGVADRIDRIMAHERRLERVLELHVLAEREGIADHQAVEPASRARRAACRASRRRRPASPPRR